MLKEQRHQMIVEYLRRHQFGRVEEFASLTNSSEITIRRDINELDKEGLVLKVHGGAQSKRNSYFDIDLKKRSMSNVEAKCKIAKAASALVEDGMLVYLDAGSSCAALIPYLSNKKITVYTHGVHHVQELAKAGLKVHLIGGDIKKETLACIGSATLTYLSQYRFDIAFIGTNAVDPDFGHSTPDVNEAMIKQILLKNSELSVILADSSKFDNKSNVAFAGKDTLVYTDLVVDKIYEEFNVKSI